MSENSSEKVTVEKVTLFHLENPGIKISMQLYFNEQNQLIFDGYDIGKSVEAAFGDSDYEYLHTVQPAEVSKFYPLFDLAADDKAALLQALKARFSVNEAYTLFAEFMKKNDIQFTSFVWR
jgi:hypothetical protein